MPRPALRKISDQSLRKKEIVKTSLDSDDDSPKVFFKGNKSFTNTCEVERLLIDNSSHLFLNEDHSNFPAFNVGIWPQTDTELIPKYPSLAFSSPIPVNVANKLVEQVDLCHKRPMARDSHRDRFLKAKSRYETATKKIKFKGSVKDDGTYHSSVFDLAEYAALDPDPYFSGSYDYFYTGGNLCALPLASNIVHVSGDNLETLHISEFPSIKDEYLTSCLENQGCMPLNDEFEIFEVQPLKFSPNSSLQNCFIARQRNLVSIQYIKGNEQLRTLSQFRTKSTPFISFAQSTDMSSLMLTTLKQHIRMYDLNCSPPKIVQLYELPNKDAKYYWNTIRAWKENTYVYANEWEFKIVDVRTQPDQWMSSVKLHSNSLYKCDHISSIKTSDFNNLAYIATNHKLHCLDIRHLSPSSLDKSEGAICRWTHQMEFPPLMIDTYRLRSNEYIALSSPIAGDMHICQLSRKKNIEKLELVPSFRVPKHIYQSPCLPYQPPTLTESYERARVLGKCLKPESNIAARLKCCTTGLTFCNPWNDDNQARGLLLYSNSIGDVYAHTLTKRETQETEQRCTDEAAAAMSEFEKKISSLTQPSLNYTDITNMKSLRKVFLCKRLSEIQQIDENVMMNAFCINDEEANAEVTAQPPKTRKRSNLGRWQKSAAALHNYKDALVQDLLSIWDIDTAEENDVTTNNLPMIKQNNPNIDNKVNDWLNANVRPSLPSTMVCIPEMNNTLDLNDTELSMLLSNNQTINTTSNIPIKEDVSGIECQLEDSHVPEDKMTKPPPKKKAKKYVKGF